MRQQTSIEEKYNVITHGFGFGLSVFGFILLISVIDYSSVTSFIGVLLYGLSLCILYFVSTRYHYETDITKKIFYRKLDHISIYLLIAGTYSPVVLISLSDSLGWTLFFLVWGIALLGVILKIFFTGRFEIFSTLLYLVMGWLIVLDFTSLKENVSDNGIYFLMGGGIAYTVGIIFYALDKLKFSHVIWHLFVLTGSVLHFLFIFYYIV